MKSIVLRALALSVGVALLVGCDKPSGPGAGPAAAQGAPMPTPEVSVVTAHASDGTDDP